MTSSSQFNYCRNSQGLWASGDNSDLGPQMGGEFVPMIIGVGVAQQVLNKFETVSRDWIRGNAQYLLGYNEPDPADNHPQSVEASVAAEDWVKVQQVAASFDPPLKLVSPAPASEDFDDDGKSEWLDYFFGNCTAIPECKPELIEAIAFHDYRGSVTGLKRRIEGMYKHYGKRKLWLTEYSIGRWNPGWPSRDEQEAYMKESLQLLESHPAVQRYVWFNSRSSPSRWGGTKDLIGDDNAITTTGQIYKDWPQGGALQPGDGGTDPLPTPPDNDSGEVPTTKPPATDPPETDPPATVEPIIYKINTQYDAAPGETKWSLKDLTGRKIVSSISYKKSRTFPPNKYISRTLPSDNTLVDGHLYKLSVYDKRSACNGMSDGGVGSVTVKALQKVDDRMTLLWEEEVMGDSYSCGIEIIFKVSKSGSTRVN